MIIITIDDTPPKRIKPTGRPLQPVYTELREKLSTLRNISKWATLELPQGISLAYARRIARAAGFETGGGDKANEIKVRYLGE